MKTLTKELQNSLTPKAAHALLIEGNKRFMKAKMAQRNLNIQVAETSKGQYPFAVIHSCIDSRVPVELVFDQGIGDVFSSRVAGNIINEDVLGSMEYGCKVAGSKIVIVMGHTKCGAVNAACQSVELGNITPLLKKIDPAIAIMKSKTNIMNEDTIEKVAIYNVHESIKQIKQESPILKEMEKDGEIEIVGALYNVATGLVEFLEDESN